MNHFNISDYINVSELHQIMSMFSGMSGMTISAFDRDNEIISPINPTSLENLTSITGTYSKQINDAVEKSFSTNHISEIISDNGLHSAAIPCSINQQPIIVIVIGQVFVDAIDGASIKRISTAYNLDMPVLCEAAKKVTIVTRIQFENYINFLSTITDKIFSLKYIDKKAIIQSESLVTKKENLINCINSAEKILTSYSSFINSLSEDFESLNMLADNTDDQITNTSNTIQDIQNIAMNTRILGFNASIEASRAKESGKGFGVIAQEVRNLADISNESAEKIEKAVANLSSGSEKIRQTIISTNTKIAENIEQMSKMSELFVEMKTIYSEIN